MSDSSSIRSVREGGEPLPFEGSSASALGAPLPDLTEEEDEATADRTGTGADDDVEAGPKSDDDHGDHHNPND